MPKITKQDREARSELLAWLKKSLFNRGCVPSYGISMFSVPELGTPVTCTVTGREIAWFSNYDAAFSATCWVDRELAKETKKA
jgi:hypothetical protein